MRITWKERRFLQRRLQHRLPAACWSWPKGVPRLGLFIVASIFIDAKVLAQAAKNGPVTSVLVPLGLQADNGSDGASSRTQSQGIYTRQWTKEDLKLSLPANPLATLDQRVAHEVAQMFGQMARNQGGLKQTQRREQLLSRMPTRDEFSVAVASMKEAPKSKNSNIDEVRAFLAGEAQAASAQRVRDQSEILQKLTGGMNFNLDVSSIFGTGEASKAQPRAQRYGLILKSIDGSNGAQDIASLNDVGDEMAFAGRADVEWTIGPIDEETGRIIGTPSVSDTDSAGGGLFGWLRLPKAKFKTNAKPELENPADLGKGTLPNWTVQVAQEENFYILTYKTKATGERISEEHQVRIPMVGEMAIGRRFNDRWDALQSSLFNVLVDQRLPSVNLHVLHLEQRMRAEAGYKINNNTTLGLEGRGESKVASVAEADRPEAYQAKLNITF